MLCPFKAPEQMLCPFKAAFSGLIGLPWYFFSASIIASLVAHVLLTGVYLVLVIKVFGRGSAVMSFLLIFILSSLLGMALVVLNDGRLFSTSRHLSVPVVTHRLRTAPTGDVAELEIETVAAELQWTFQCAMLKAL